jgi:hypothetical protein
MRITWYGNKVMSTDSMIMCFITPNTNMSIFSQHGYGWTRVSHIQQMKKMVETTTTSLNWTKLSQFTSLLRTPSEFTLWHSATMSIKLVKRYSCQQDNGPTYSSLLSNTADMKWWSLMSTDKSGFTFKTTNIFTIWGQQDTSTCLRISRDT